MEIKDVEGLAGLARLKLTEEEKIELLSDMDSILGYVKQIEEMKIEDTEPDHKVLNVWRKDIQEARDFSGELITDQFPASQDGFLKVKKIL